MYVRNHFLLFCYLFLLIFFSFTFKLFFFGFLFFLFFLPIIIIIVVVCIVLYYLVFVYFFSFISSSISCFCPFPCVLFACYTLKTNPPITVVLFNAVFTISLLAVEWFVRCSLLGRYACWLSA